ncbi:hypothetical protein [Thermocatellispora tengchongensis]|uniref:hypothetical protein n=1 Tax=Thermocatellispora tengchongensis TaxID=1073253 RepID=UPI00363A45DD
MTGFDGLAAATGLDGARADLRPVPDALPEGTPLAFELVAGAPGMAEDAVTAALDRLAGGRAWRLAGLRPYRMPVGATCWGAACRGAPARPDPDLDLARWVPFDAPGTMTPEEVSALIAAWLDRHAAHADLFPGRLAAAALMPAPGRGGPDPYWDPAAQVVEARGDGPDGRGPGTFAVSLRSGRAYRLHPRLVPAVTALAGGDPRALAGLPERARERVLGELTRAGVVRSRA